MILTNSSIDVPSVHVTTNRNRVKTYGSVAYMKSGTHFEIEIFNPTQGRLLSKIKIDGRDISSTGIVINPGQRVYLERWIDEPKKFKFSTYDVENSSQAKKAIEQNGKIEVSLYCENIHISNNWNTISTGTSNWNQYPYTLTTNTGFGVTTTNMYYSSDSTQISGSYFSNNLGVVGTDGLKGIAGNPGPAGPVGIRSSIETGRTEKGAASDQSFDETSGDFGTWPMMTISLQILPESAKPVEVEKIRSYCTECGTRVRSSSWKFCPSCGSKM